MKISYLKSFVYDKIIIYKEDVDSGDFVDLYKGYLKDVPEELLSKDVRVIGAKRKGIIDIEIR